MQVKVLLPLLAAALVAGFPEPDPNTKVDVNVDSGDSKVDSYFGVVKTAGKTTFKLVSRLFGKAMGYKSCEVEVPFSWPVKEYIKYENGATDVPCAGRLAGKNGTCVDGNVVCEIDNMGVASSEVTFEVDNNQNNDNKTIMLNVVPGSSLFDVMNIAQQKDNKFRFTYTLDPGVVYITGIGGVEESILENATSAWVWALYNCTAACIVSYTGVSTTYPNNGDIWKFRYQFYNW